MKRKNLFVVGTPFSGATLLSQMLGAHPQMFLAGDLAHLAPLTESGPSGCRSCDAAGRACAVWQHPTVVAARANGPAATYDALASATGREVIIDASKTPRWLATRLNDPSPAGRPTHIVICTSDPLLTVRAHQMLTHESASACAELWHDENARLLQAAFASNCPVLVVRFDELAAHTEDILRRVTSFVDTTFDEAAFARWFDAPTHAAGMHAESAWDGISLAALAPSATADSAPGTEQHRDAAWTWLGAQEGPPLHLAEASEVRDLIAASPVTQILNYAVELPAHDVNESPESRERTIAWVRERLTAAREAMLEDRSDEAFATLLLLFNHFGAAFDTLALDLSFEGLATVITDMLSRAGQFSDAATVTAEVLAAKPHSAEARRMHATALLRAGDVDSARPMVQALLEESAPDAVGDAALPDSVTQVLLATHPDDRAMTPFLSALGRHPRLAACVEATLEAVPAAQRTPEAWAALGLTHMCHGDLDAAAHVLEEALTYHSRSVKVANALFAVHARQHPDDPRYQLQGRFCPKPFENIELLPGGPAHMCCAVWMPDAIGNVYQAKQWQDVWNSPTAQSMRESILDGSYRWCNKLSCPVIQNAELVPFVQVTEPQFQTAIAEHQTVLDFAPATVNLSYDKSCNLSCPSCRTKVIMSNDAERKKIDEMTDRVVLPLLAGARRTTITGSGDPFASRTFRRLLLELGERDYPNLRYEILTNAQLLTPETWEKFPQLKERTDIVAVSMDAATPETYRIVRRPGEIGKVIQNLQYMKQLVERGELKAFGLRFVVQVENFREMPAFVRLAKEVGASDVMFQRLINWDTFTQEEFAKRAVFLEEHPLYPEFLKVMQDPILQDPMVNLGMLRAFVQNGDHAESHAAAA